MPNHQFQVDAWMSADTHLETVATSCNVNVARAAFEAAKVDYSVRLTLKDRMQVIAVREDTIMTRKSATSVAS